VSPFLFDFGLFMQPTRPYGFACSTLFRRRIPFVRFTGRERAGHGKLDEYVVNADLPGSAAGSDRKSASAGSIGGNLYAHVVVDVR
jgi:hypothetical protein